MRSSTVVFSSGRAVMISGEQWVTLVLSVALWGANRAVGRNLTGSPNMDNSAELEPVFLESIPSVTMAIGRDAKMTCVVDRLGTYRVAWLRLESKTILTIHRHVITRNYRINLSHADHRHWTLRIADVQESDRGGYMCQVNTVPMKSQVGYLDVVVPPDILDTESSSDVLVREGANVTLTCRASGYPNPTISWRREDAKSLAVGNWQSTHQQETMFEGPELSITKVSRLHMGAYLCIASNNVPPSVSRRILLHVNFPPMIWIPNQLVGVPLGGDVTLDCNTEASPKSINYWTREEGDMIVTGAKYRTTQTVSGYKVHMSLTIRRVQQLDFGFYKCFAKNALGSTEGSIRLYEIHESPQPVKEPATVKVQSLEEGKYGLSDDGLTKMSNPSFKSQIASYPTSGFSSSASVPLVSGSWKTWTLIHFLSCTYLLYGT